MEERDLPLGLRPLQLGLEPVELLFVHVVGVEREEAHADAAPFSSVPPSLLLKLPPLPEEVRYRFVGRSLILRDTEANVILDYIPDGVPDRTMPR